MSPTLIDLDGFSHQTVATSQGGSGFIGVYDTISRAAGISFDTTNKRLAAHVASLKVVEDNTTATYVSRNIAAGNRLLVVSFYFRVTANPVSNSNIFVAQGPTNPIFFRVQSSGAVAAIVSTGTAQVTSGTGYADGNWHRIDGRIDTSGTTYTVDWQVDGVAQTQATLGSQTAADISSWRLGSGTASHDVTAWLQDFVLSATTGDYPIGDHVVLPLYPNGNGTHSLGTTNAIVDEVAGNSDLSSKVDEWNGGLPNTTDYVTYTSTTLGDAASNFAEFTVTDPDSSYATIWDVIGVIAGFSAGTNADNADTQVLTAHGGTLIDHIGNLIDYSGSTTVLGYYRQKLARPSGGWTSANLTAVVVQWGRSTDTNPLPRLSAVMLEYAAAVDITATPTGLNASITLGSPTVTETVTVTPTGLANTVALGSPVISGALTVNPTGLANAIVPGTPSVSQVVIIAPDGKDNSVALGSPVVSGAITVNPDGVSNAVAVGTPSVSLVVTLTPDGVSSVIALGTPSVSQVVIITPDGKDNPILLGAPVVSGSTTAIPNGLNGSIVLGSPTMSSSVTLTPDGKDNSIALGSPSVTQGQIINPSGVSNPATLGSPSVSLTVNVTPTGVFTTAAGAVGMLGAVTIVPAGVSAAPALGTPAAGGTLVTVPGGIGSTAALGQPTVTVTYLAFPSGIDSTILLGGPLVSMPWFAVPDGIASTLQLGRPHHNITLVFPVDAFLSTVSIGEVAISDVNRGEALLSDQPRALVSLGDQA